MKTATAKPSDSHGELRKPSYSFTFDRAKDTWVCSVHGPVDLVGWVRCWNGCDDGYFDAYEDDPINNDDGDLDPCDVCGTKGGWMVCGECNRDNPDIEY